jgi:hypothetical protein
MADYSLTESSEGIDMIEKDSITATIIERRDFAFKYRGF